MVGHLYVGGAYQLDSLIDSETFVNGDVAYPRATQANEMSSTTEGLADVACQSPDICALAADYAQLQAHLFGVEGNDVNAVNDKDFGLKLNVLSLTCHLISAAAVNLAG